MKTLILDNYDSFTYNLYQYVAELGGEPVVKRNDEVAMTGVKTMELSHIIISPGPGNPDTPRDVGISYSLIDYAKEEGIPLLGVCLGHQAVGHHFGGSVIRAPEVFHGKASKIYFREPRDTLFQGLPEDIEVMRYHSLCIDPPSLSSDFHITAETKNGIIMAIAHKQLPLFGIQFHPESIGTPEGKAILRNFLLVGQANVDIDSNSQERIPAPL